MLFSMSSGGYSIARFASGTAASRADLRQHSVMTETQLATLYCARFTR